ncbi:MAG: ferrochelatase [Raoultibacter sp.]|jgi:ferrochelatase
MDRRPTCGILLANTGSPQAPTKREIKRFLGRFLMDRRIAPTNRVFWWLLLHLHILPLRGKRNVGRYEEIWTDEGNPLLVAQQRLAWGLQKAYESDPTKSIAVTCGMNYSSPDTLEGIKHLKEIGCEQILVLPLYPQSAYSTTGSVYDAVERVSSKLKLTTPCDLIDNYYDNSTYIRAIAASIKHAGFNVDSDDRLLFSFHSIPLIDIENGDTYEPQTSSSSLSIAGELGIDRKRWTIGYQCRFDKGREWLKPDSRDILSRWAESSGGRVFVVCPGFAIDCLETLFDVEREYRTHYLNACRAAGKQVSEHDFIYVPCLDKSKAHVRVLKDVLDPYLEELNNGETR